MLNKYLKYKTKYLKLYKEQFGGTNLLTNGDIQLIHYEDLLCTVNPISIAKYDDYYENNEENLVFQLPIMAYIYLLLYNDIEPATLYDNLKDIVNPKNLPEMYKNRIRNKEYKCIFSGFYCVSVNSDIFYDKEIYLRHDIAAMYYILTKILSKEDSIHLDINKFLYISYFNIKDESYLIYPFDEDKHNNILGLLLMIIRDLKYNKYDGQYSNYSIFLYIFNKDTNIKEIKDDEHQLKEDKHQTLLEKDDIDYIDEVFIEDKRLESMYLKILISIWQIFVNECYNLYVEI